MAFVSVTRLRPRSVRFLPSLLFHSWRSSNQLKRSTGYLGGYLASSTGHALWTVTLWSDQAAMRAYRNTGAHLRAMPRLIDYCCEASIAHWETLEAAVPGPEEVAERLAGGRLSKVRHPSPAHAEGRAWPDGKVPLKGPTLSSR